MTGVSLCVIDGDQKPTLVLSRYVTQPTGYLYRRVRVCQPQGNIGYGLVCDRHQDGLDLDRIDRSVGGWVASTIPRSTKEGANHPTVITSPIRNRSCYDASNPTTNRPMRATKPNVPNAPGKQPPSARMTRLPPAEAMAPRTDHPRYMNLRISRSRGAGKCAPSWTS